MIVVDDLILETISINFKTVKQISEELTLPYVRVSVRIKQLRKKNMLISIRTNESGIKGVKPLKYKIKN